jgi:hypothetical protein
MLQMPDLVFSLRGRAHNSIVQVRLRFASNKQTRSRSIWKGECRALGKGQLMLICQRTQWLLEEACISVNGRLVVNYWPCVHACVLIPSHTRFALRPASNYLVVSLLAHTPTISLILP